MNSNSNPNPAPRRITMDLSPRQPTVTSRLAASEPHPAKRPSAAAAALHQRAKPGHILDLRQAQSQGQPTAPVVAAQPPSKPVVPPITNQNPSSSTPVSPAQVNPTTPTPPQHVPASPPKSTLHERHQAHLANRLDQARQVDRSPIIKKFAHSAHAAPAPIPPGQSLPLPVQPQPAALTSQPPASATVVSPPAAPAPTPPPAPPAAETIIPPHTVTQHQAMTRLISPAPAPITPATASSAAVVTPDAKPRQTSWRPRLSLTPQVSRVLTGATAVAIMGGYIWLQNYPKLTIQSAGNKAGLAATLPGYVPSSYNLAHTEIAPGLVTLSFASPSLPEQLKIAQARTTWDSSTLLDNYVSKHADDYSAVDGQGLTIYLFGDNKATWVNHGIWYSIEGATRLSREQILKIAYSL